MGRNVLVDLGDGIRRSGQITDLLTNGRVKVAVGTKTVEIDRGAIVG